MTLKNSLKTKRSTRSKSGKSSKFRGGWLHTKNSTWSSKRLFTGIIMYLSSLNSGWTLPRLITTSKFLAMSFSGRMETRINWGRDRFLHTHLKHRRNRGFLRTQVKPFSYVTKKLRNG